MKLIIDIPEEEYKTGQLVKFFGCYSEKLDSVIYSGTPIESQSTDKCKGCYYNDGETHAECVVCDKEAQPTSDAVSRETVISAICAWGTNKERNSEVMIPMAEVKQSIADIVADLPSVQPQRKQGYWIFKNDNIAIPTGYYQCSECEEGKLLVKDNYCPNCGSYNGGEEDEVD